MSVNLIIFDLDGTLIDSGRVVLAILNKLRFEIGLEEIPLDRVIPTLSLGGAEMIKATLQIDDDLRIKKYLEEFRRQYHLFKTTSDSVYPGVYFALTELGAKGFDLCVCTNKPRRLANKVLDETNLSCHFSYVVAGGDVPTNKPDPAHVYACLGHFGALPADTFYVGDSSIDQITCARASVPFIFFTEGYDDGVDAGAAGGHFSDYMTLPSIILTR